MPSSYFWELLKPLSVPRSPYHTGLAPCASPTCPHLLSTRPQPDYYCSSWELSTGWQMLWKLPAFGCQRSLHSAEMGEQLLPDWTPKASQEWISFCHPIAPKQFYHVQDITLAWNLFKYAIKNNLFNYVPCFPLTERAQIQLQRLDEYQDFRCGDLKWGENQTLILAWRIERQVRQCIWTVSTSLSRDASLGSRHGYTSPHPCIFLVSP